MTQTAVRARGELGGNTSTGWLKIIALVFMACDHAGKMLFPNVPELRILGRIAFPLYAWCMVVGFHYTRSPLKYALRLLAVGLISQPLYVVALNHTWAEPNIFLTLVVALLALWVTEPKDWETTAATKLAGRALAVFGVVACLAAATVLNCNYGWRGVLLVLLLWAVRDKSAGIAAVMIAFCLFWGGTSGGISSIFGLNISLGTVGASLLSPWLRLQALAILALPFMLIPFKHQLKMPAWLGYALYPAHLLVLWGLEAIL